MEFTSITRNFNILILFNLSSMRALLDQEVDMEELFEESDGDDDEFSTKGNNHCYIY
jgi:hypothetical protein